MRRSGRVRRVAARHSWGRRPRLVLSLAVLQLASGGCSPGDPRPSTDADGVEPAPIPAGQAPASRFLGLLPDGEEKRRFILDCTGCHQFDATTVGVDGRFRSRDDWRARTAQMLSFAGARTGFPVISPSREPQATADWLVEALGDETRRLPSFDSRGDGRAGTGRSDGRAGAVAFAEYPFQGDDLPHDLALDPAGRVVVTGQLSGRMYVLDPTTGTFTESTPIPTPQANPRAVEIDAEGVWWVLLGGPQQVARHDPGTGEWRTWDIGMHPHSIVRAPDGLVWFNGHFSRDPELIGVLDPRSGRVRTYDVPTPPMADGGTTMPYGLRRAPDGTLWGTQLMGNRLVKFDPGTREFELFSLPTSVSGPRRPDVAADGTVWIPQYAASSLARFDPATETFTEYELPIPDALPYVVRVDSRRGWVWIGTAAADALLRFHPEEERFEVHPLPTPHAIVRHMALDADSGTLWLAYGNFPPRTPKVVRVQVR